MKLGSIGSAQRFEHLEKGDAFFWMRHGKKYVGIRTEGGGDVGAVLITLDRSDASGIPSPISNFSKAQVFAGSPILSTPALKFMICPSVDQISMGESISPQPGKIYLFDSNRMFLAFRIYTETGLLNIDSGDVSQIHEFKTYMRKGENHLHLSGRVGAPLIS